MCSTQARSRSNRVASLIYQRYSRSPGDCKIGVADASRDALNAERALIAAECIGDGRWFIDTVTNYPNERIKTGSVSIPSSNATELIMKIPKKLQPHLNSAYPAHVITIGTVLSDGFAQISPRGSVQVYDDDHLSTWERGIGRTQEQIRDGSPVTFYYANFDLIAQGMGFVRLYGRASVHRSGAVYEKVWERLIEPEKQKDPERKGFALLVAIERVEDLRGTPLTD